MAILIYSNSCDELGSGMYFVFVFQVRVVIRQHFYMEITRIVHEPWNYVNEFWVFDVIIRKDLILKRRQDA